MPIRLSSARRDHHFKPLKVVFVSLINASRYYGFEFFRYYVCFNLK